MGYIMTSRPIARPNMLAEELQLEGGGLTGKRGIPIGTLTPTNCPFCNVGPVLGTKAPSKMPIVIASIIHMTRNRSSKLRPRRGGTSLKSGCESGDTVEPKSILAYTPNSCWKCQVLERYQTEI